MGGVSILTRLRRRRLTRAADPVGELIKQGHIFDTPERRAVVRTVLGSPATGNIAPPTQLGWMVYGWNATEPSDFLLQGGARLSELIDDEIVRQLAALLRDHPAVVAALEEVA